MATVVLYRGYLGYQQRVPTGRNEAYPRDFGTIDAYISNGVLTLPILPWLPDVDDFGNRGSVAHYYSGPCSSQYEYVQMDDSNFSYMFFYSDASRQPTITKSPIATTHTLQCVISNDMAFASYLNGLIAAHATLEQIDQFVQEHDCGTGVPFIWVKMLDVMDKVEASKSKKTNLEERMVVPDPIRADKPTFGNIIPIIKSKEVKKKSSCTESPSQRTKKQPSLKRTDVSKTPSNGAVPPKPSTAKNTRNTTKRRVRSTS